MKKPSELTIDETTQLFDQAKPYLNQINVTGEMDEDQKLKLFLGARWIDVRVRMDGREYYFEGEFLRTYINSLKSEINKLELCRETQDPNEA